MFQWSKKVVKSVTFNPGVADESLLALVESHLEKQPDKTFSDLCKEALWQSLCVPESVRPGPKPAATESVEQRIGELQHQMADLEERFFAKESNRLETMERQILQLTQQVAKLTIILNQEPLTCIPSDSVSVAPAIPQEVDPVISRIGQFLDDF